MKSHKDKMIKRPHLLPRNVLKLFEVWGQLHAYIVYVATFLGREAQQESRGWRSTTQPRPHLMRETRPHSLLHSLLLCQLHQPQVSQRCSLTNVFNEHYVLISKHGLKASNSTEKFSRNICWDWDSPTFISFSVLIRVLKYPLKIISSFSLIKAHEMDLIALINFEPSSFLRVWDFNYVLILLVYSFY